jgi:hypothetical protein
MKPSKMRRLSMGCALVSCLLIASIAVAAQENQQKPPLKERARTTSKTLIKDMKSLGRGVKNSEATREIIRLGKDVGRLTQGAWKDTLEGRKATLNELRKKNKELRQKIERGNKSRETTP